jgi:hypothetical protein
VLSIDSIQATTLILLEGIVASYDGPGHAISVTVVPARFGSRSHLHKQRVELHVRRIDLLLAAATLLNSGVPFKPTRGDTITVNLGNGSRTYRVSPDEGEPDWEDSDPSGVLLRVRCVEES